MSIDSTNEQQGARLDHAASDVVPPEAAAALDAARTATVLVNEHRLAIPIWP